MKIYIAARSKTRLDEVKEIQTKLVKMGHIVAYDWTKDGVNVRRPYRDHTSRKHNEKESEKMLQAAAEADVLVFLDEPGLRGAYVEMGAFLLDGLKNPENRKVFIVGPNSHEREHIFESPAFVHFVDSINEIYKFLK